MIFLLKIAISLFWLAELANLFQVFNEPFAKTLHIASIVVLALHVFELMIFNKLINESSNDAKRQKLMVLFFGFVHLRTLMNKQKLNQSLP